MRKQLSLENGNIATFVGARKVQFHRAEHYKFTSIGIYCLQKKINIVKMAKFCEPKKIIFARCFVICERIATRIHGKK